MHSLTRRPATTMRRGTARGMVHGGGGSQALLNRNLWALNMSFIQMLQTGYFEKDVMSYCANRLMEYSCIYWLDPTISNVDDGIDFVTAAYNFDYTSIGTFSDKIINLYNVITQFI